MNKTILFVLMCKEWKTWLRAREKKSRKLCGNNDQRALVMSWFARVFSKSFDEFHTFRNEIQPRIVTFGYQSCTTLDAHSIILRGSCYHLLEITFFKKFWNWGGFEKDYVKSLKQMKVFLNFLPFLAFHCT